MRQKWGRSQIQKEVEYKDQEKVKSAVNNNARRDGLFTTAICFANSQPDLTKWSKGAKDVTPAQMAFGKLAMGGLLKATPERILKKILVDIGALELPIEVQIPPAVSKKEMFYSYAEQSGAEV